MKQRQKLKLLNKPYQPLEVVHGMIAGTAFCTLFTLRPGEFDKVVHEDGDTWAFVRDGVVIPDTLAFTLMNKKFKPEKNITKGQTSHIVRRHKGKLLFAVKGKGTLQPLFDGAEDTLRKATGMRQRNGRVQEEVEQDGCKRD